MQISIVCKRKTNQGGNMKKAMLVTDVIITDGGNGAIISGKFKGKEMHFKVKVIDLWEKLGLERAL